MDTSSRNFVPNCGLRKFHYGASIVAASIISTKANAHCDKLVSVVGHTTVDARPTTLICLCLSRLTVRLCVQHDALKVARLAVYL